MTHQQYYNRLMQNVPRPLLPDEPKPFESPRLRGPHLFLHEIGETVLFIMLIYCTVNIATIRYVVEGPSMAPNFESDQGIIVDRLVYLLSEPGRGDVVIFHNPENPQVDFIKRVIGLPGETVRIFIGRVYINGMLLDEPYIQEFCQNQRCDGTWQLGKDQYFVLGDNREHSYDGHSFGPIPRQLIVGQAWIRYWPPAEWGVIPHYTYGRIPAISLQTPERP